MPNNVKPVDVMDTVVAAGTTKSKLPLLDMALRGLYSGFLLACSSSLASLATQQTGVSLVGALLFPSGFIMIVLFGFELVTGNFLVIPVSLMAGKAHWLGMLRNWLVVWTTNLLGTSLCLAFFYGGMTNFGLASAGALGDTIIATGRTKTWKYSHDGGAGWAAAFFKGIMCNFLVSFAVLASMTSTSSIGKIVAAWLPVVMFAAMGYEHVVVNMFIIPCSMVLGSGVSWGDWWFWNLLPVTLGNLVGAVVLVSIPMWVTWGHEYRKRMKLELEQEKEKELDAETKAVDSQPNGSDEVYNNEFSPFYTVNSSDHLVSNNGSPLVPPGTPSPPLYPALGASPVIQV